MSRRKYKVPVLLNNSRISRLKGRTDEEILNKLEGVVQNNIPSEYKDQDLKPVLRRDASGRITEVLFWTDRSLTCPLSDPN